jgi:hypothetical protein
MEKYIIELTQEKYDTLLNGLNLADAEFGIQKCVDLRNELIEKHGSPSWE